MTHWHIDHSVGLVMGRRNLGRFPTPILQRAGDSASAVCQGQRRRREVDSALFLRMEGQRPGLLLENELAICIADCRIR